MSRERSTHTFFTGALFPRGGNDRRRESNQEAMVCFKDAAIHGRRDQDSVFPGGEITVPEAMMFPRTPWALPMLPPYPDRCCLCEWLFMKSL